MNNAGGQPNEKSNMVIGSFTNTNIQNATGSLPTRKPGSLGRKILGSSGMMSGDGSNGINNASRGAG